MSKENSWREKGDAGGPQVKKRKMYPVDDELLTLLRTIRHEHVLMVLELVLRAEGYCIDGIELTWIKFAEDSGAAGDFYSPRADNLHAVYLAEISGEVRAYAVYQPFSQKLYVLEPEEVIYRSGFSAGEYVQFTLGYGSFKCPFSIYTRIRRRSRCFRFEKRWFRREFQLYAREDRLVERDVVYSGQSLEEGFYLDSESKNLISYRAMYFRSVEDE